MMTMLRSRTISVSIKRDPKVVYEFVLNLENLPRWARMAFRSIKQLNGEWVADTPQDSVTVNLTERNDFGILDHYVKTHSGVVVFVPMRVIKNGDGSEVMLTVFQTTDMSEEKFVQDIALVEQDLKT